MFEEKKPGRSERILYLDGLKGAACIFIMLGHFAGIYKYAETASAIECGFLKSFTVFPISFFCDEDFWLFLFFVISGYLAAFSKIQGLMDVFRKTVLRFLRLFVPVCGAILITFIIGHTAGFHNQELRSLIDNPWFFRSYQDVFDFKDLLLEPFKVFWYGGSKFNSPLWVMKDMLLSSMLIYCINCIIRNEKSETIRHCGCALAIIALAGCVIIRRYAIFGCLCGACVNWADKYRELLYSRAISWGMCIFLVAAFFLKIAVIRAIAISLWLITVEKSVIGRIFSMRFPVWLGSISLGVFMLHWPIYNSIGMLIFMRFYSVIENSVLFCGVFTVSFMIVCLCAIAFKNSFEPFTAFLVKTADGWIKKL